jgi:hypothetical protein
MHLTRSVKEYPGSDNCGYNRDAENHPASRQEVSESFVQSVLIQPTLGLTQSTWSAWPRISMRQRLLAASNCQGGTQAKIF